jgi:protein-S-isoprenylcysteine O-methyltransferase Ste14
MNRGMAFAYGIGAYGLFLATFLYAIAFVGDLGVAHALDGRAAGPWALSVLIDLALLGAFAAQHSGMARRGFKQWLTRFVNPVIERSTFVVASSVLLLLLITQWRPLGGVIWSADARAVRIALYCGFGFGWGLVLITTFVINHFELFGLQQVWRNLRGRPQSHPPFVTPIIYQIVRHPLYLGFLFAFWCTPTMTAAHLLFAAMTTAYILSAIQLEERDLVRTHPEYASYRQRVPMLIPRFGLGPKSPAPADSSSHVTLSRPQ